MNPEEICVCACVSVYIHLICEITSIAFILKGKSCSLNVFTGTKLNKPYWYNSGKYCLVPYGSVS